MSAVVALCLGAEFAVGSATLRTSANRLAMPKADFPDTTTLLTSLNNRKVGICRQYLRANTNGTWWEIVIASVHNAERLAGLL